MSSYPERDDLDEMAEDELTTLLGRLEVEEQFRERLKDDIIDALAERSGGFENYTHCILCGVELTNDLDWDTGVCTPCVEAEP